MNSFKVPVISKTSESDEEFEEFDILIFSEAAMVA